MKNKGKPFALSSPIKSEASMKSPKGAYAASRAFHYKFSAGYLDGAAQLAQWLSVGLAARRGEEPADFLRKNGITPYYVHESSWRESARPLDLILWPVPALPWVVEEAREKIYFLEKILKKRMVPSFSQIMLFRHFPHQYAFLKARGLPMVPAFITYDYDEACRYVQEAEMPLLCRREQELQFIREEVLLTRREAKKMVFDAFRLGIPGLWPGHRDKQCIILMKAPEKEDLRGTFIYAGAYAFFGHGSRPSQADQDFEQHLWALACRVRALGLRDSIIEFRINRNSGALLLETAHPLFPGAPYVFSPRNCYSSDESPSSAEIEREFPDVEQILMEGLLRDELKNYEA